MIIYYIKNKFKLKDDCFITIWPLEKDFAPIHTLVTLIYFAFIFCIYNDVKS